MTIRHSLQMTTIVGALILTLPAIAAVSGEETSRLKTTLTPLGAEKAGNKEGTIPAWDGGYTKPIPGDKLGGRRGDPFAGEKPLFSVTAKNMDQYAAKLTDGVKAMLKKYPDSYRLDIYATHRTGAAPQWVYDNTFKNATRGKLNGDVAENVYGGIPFPIPKSGAEVMWNHLLRWRGESYMMEVRQHQLTADGKKVLISDSSADVQLPYYLKDGSPEQYAKAPEYWLIRFVTVGPPVRAGEAIVGRQSMDGEKEQAWVYLAGQRRVRKLPNACCDTPSPVAGGLTSFDESEVWLGRINRFDWTLVGKQEMYVPYNGNRLLQPAKDDEVLGTHHLNPDYLRWELHRVWVVEANLRQGKRHQAPKSRYYCDEDTWNCVLADRWDANGQLWKTLWMVPYVMPDLPATVGVTFGFNDLLSGAGFVSNLMNQKAAQYPIKPHYKDTVFTPDAMAGEGVR